MYRITRPDRTISRSYNILLLFFNYPVLSGHYFYLTAEAFLREVYGTARGTPTTSMQLRASRQGCSQYIFLGLLSRHGLVTCGD